jgi:hypothetical protein
MSGIRLAAEGLKRVSESVAWGVINKSGWSRAGSKPGERDMHNLIDTG